jgi:hypothetical protein
MKSKANLEKNRTMPKKIDQVDSFTSKKRANERAKTLMKKQAKDMSHLLLKANKTTANDIMDKDNGFVTLLKIGDKIFVVSEGAVGRKFDEDPSYIKDLAKKAEKVEPDLGDPILNATVKSLYLKNTESHENPNNQDNPENPNNLENHDSPDNQGNSGSSLSSNSEKQTLTDRRYIKRARTLSQVIANRAGSNAVNVLANRSKSGINVKPARKKRMFVCNYCQKKYDSKKKVKAHTRDKHHDSGSSD